MAAVGVSVALLAACSSASSDVEVRPSAPPTATGSDDEASATVDIAPTETDGETATSVETTAAPTPSTGPATVAAPAYDFGEIDPIVQAAVDANGLGGAGLLVVDRDDGVVHEQYWGEFGPDRVSLVASSSKMIVAGVLLALADDGLLDLDAPVADVAPWGSGNPTITPAQLVSNSSGLVGLGPNPAYPPYVCQFLPAGTLQDCAASIFTTTADDADVIAPDTEFRYGGAQWQVAGAVAEVASGRTWAELIEQVYVEPCGVDSLGFANHWTEFGLGFDYPAAFAGDPSTVSATDNPNIEGGAYITAPDYAQLLLMLLRDGRCGDEQVLSSESIERMLADRIGEVYGGSDGDRGYGMGWFVDRTSGIRTDPGAYGSVAWIDADAGYAAYLVIEGAGRVGNALAAELFGPVANAFADS
jgi:CubicO group peptidase (beta-lactamase class C family)